MSEINKEHIHKAVDDVGFLIDDLTAAYESTDNPVYEQYLKGLRQEAEALNLRLNKLKETIEHREKNKDHRKADN